MCPVLTYEAMVDKLVQRENLNRFSDALKDSQKRLFSAFFLHVRGNAPSHSLQQLLTFLTIKSLLFNNKVHKTTLSCEYTSPRTGSQLIMRVIKAHTCIQIGLALQ